MEHRDRSFTLIIAPSTPSRVKQFRVTTSHIYSFLIALVILSLFGLYGIFHYTQAIRTLADYREVLASHNLLQEENLQYKEKTRQLGEKLSHIEMITRNISRLTGIDLEGPRATTGGIGGFSGGNWANKDLNALNVNYLNSLSQKTSSIQSEVIHLKDAALEQNLFLSSLPTSWPVRGYIGSPFGSRTDPVSGGREFHEGLDISAPYGSQILSPADGVVLFNGAQRGYGYCIVIAHKYGITTRYAHLSSMAVKVGDRVKKGEILGYIGNTGKATGPHLHFEVHINGKPVNPMRFLGTEANS